MKILWSLIRRFGMGAITIGSVLLTLYIFWYQEFGKTGELTLLVKAQGNVLTLQRQIPGVEVLYKGSPLTNTDKSLKFYSVQIRNTGQIHILKAFFDDQVPWGFRIRGADILRITNTSYSVEALANTQPTEVNPTFIKLTPVNLDIGDWIRIDFLALADANKEQTFEFSGRISGTHLTVRYELPGTEPSLLSQAFSGSAFVQIARLLGYPFLFLLGLVAIGGILGGSFASYGFYKRQRRKRYIASIDLRTDQSFDRVRTTIERLYIDDGWVALLRLRDQLGNERFLEALAEAGRKYKQLGEASTAVDEIERRRRSFREVRKVARNSKLGSVSERLLVKVAFNDDANIDPTRVRAVLALIDQLDGALPSKGKAIDNSAGHSDVEELRLQAIYSLHDD